MSGIVIAGDVHGAIGLFYEQALRLQDELKEPIEAILQVGDLQVYSEESHVDKAPFDILLTHEAPDGVVSRDGVDLGRPEIGALIRKVTPRFAFFGHHHWHTKAEIGSTTVVGLSRIQREGGMYPIRY
ncbi:MAG: metallophosphoesterase family protein [bacterium]